MRNRLTEFFDIITTDCPPMARPCFRAVCLESKGIYRVGEWPRVTGVYNRDVSVDLEVISDANRRSSFWRRRPDILSGAKIPVGAWVEMGMRDLIRLRFS